MSDTKTPTIQNPYSQLEESEITRIQSFVGSDDYALVRRVSDGKGFMVACTAILWQKFVNELKSYGITDYTRNEDFIELVNNLDIKYVGRKLNRHGGTTGRVTPKRHVKMDGAGVEGVRDKATGTENVGS